MIIQIYKYLLIPVGQLVGEKNGMVEIKKE